MMTRAQAELGAVDLCRARNRLLSAVQTMLAGSGLEIRARKRKLVIANPDDRDRGRIYINYVTGEMSWQQSTWNFLGHLKGYAQASETDVDAELVADAEAIIHALRGDGGGSS
ncbi:MAG TPA: hypothetical protein VGH27_23005 [Streptosporangiaceae bacterium]|jgi:hypothetical protein